MKISVNQLRLELADIEQSHLQLNTFFWGDFPRAVNEENINYPLMASYFPNAGFLDNQTTLPITIVIADKIYDDYTNLNDVESDTLQICRDVFNIMNKSTRWQKIGRVESCSLTKFIESNADVCAGYVMTVNFTLRDSNSICDLPMSGYDFDQVIGASCLPVQIYRNGVLVDTVASGGTYSYTTDAFTYTIKNTDLVTLYSGNVTANLSVTIQDCTVSNSDASYLASIVAQGNLDLPDITVDVINSLDVVVSTQISASVQDVTISAPDGTINIKKTGDGTISSQSVPSGATVNYSVADNAITVNSTNGFTIDATDPLDIVLTDGTSSVTPTSVTYSQGQHKVDIVLPENVTPHWTRNADWLPLDTVTAGSQKFSGLFAVYETQKNVCTIQCETGTRTIDWGDGTTQVALTSTLYTKVYDYASITSPIITDEFGYNYKTVVVNIPMTSCTQLYIDRNTTATVINNSRSLNWLDIALDCSTLIVFSPSGQAISNKLERLLIYNVGSFISGAPSFIQMPRLKVLKFPFEKIQSSNQMFTNYLGDIRNEDGSPINMNLSINTGSLFNLISLSSITRLGNFTATLSTSGQSLFENSSQLISIGNINLSSATNIVSTFASCTNLENVVNITITSTCTNITQIGSNARKCKGFIIGNCSGVTSATNAFFNMVSMETLILTGMTRGFVIDDCNMSATAIDALFTSLGTASGSQTISVKRNPGSATCTTSIATSKGFTVLTA